ncbi:metal-dependent hydrolase [Halovivax limisalsi]|uniref:metal-dependent hydrolase n=1 Tax=Halovivax limisalsi TaxID=1453760 RepID=UPI001FFDC52C|nr:metal-dependent hydrolase [Halovivax limisalsi]
MMATTHALVGMAVALPVIVGAPELAPVAILAGAVGGLLPDLDLYVGHRRTLHYPVYGWLAAGPAIGLALLSPSTVTVGLAVGLTAAALHAVTDVAGAGLELRPWQAGSDRAVYSHYHGRWLRARRWVRYDGAPEDLALASLAGAGAITVAGEAAGLVTVGLVGGLLAISTVYALLRRSLADLAVRLVGYVPASIRMHVPQRYCETDPSGRR